MSEVNVNLAETSDLPPVGEVVAVMLTGVFANTAKETGNIFLSLNGMIVYPEEYSGATAKRSPIMLQYTPTWAAKKHQGATPAFLRSIAQQKTASDQKGFLAQCRAMFGKDWDDMFQEAGEQFNQQLFQSMVGKVFWVQTLIESYRDDTYVTWKVVKNPTSLEELGLVGEIPGGLFDGDDDIDTGDARY